METRQVEVAPGVTLAADTWDPAPGGRSAAVPFVLVHGLASNARLWDGVAARLVERGQRAVTVDLRGHGRSSKPDGPYDVATVADDVAALIAALGLDRPVVAGQSWGGNVVLELAVRHRAALRGIVGVDGGWLELRHAFESLDACVAALTPPRLAGTPRVEIERRIRAAHPDWPETGIAGALANFETRADGTIAPWLTLERHLAILRALWDHLPSQHYPDVHVPVLLVPAASDQDARAHLKRGAVDRAMRHLPSARVRWFEGDHDIHAQRPVELADVMLDNVADGFLT